MGTRMASISRNVLFDEFYKATSGPGTHISLLAAMEERSQLGRKYNFRPSLLPTVLKSSVES